MVVGLKAKNRVRKLKRIAEELSSRIALYEEVAGIAFHGALTRGFADEFSDIDITVFLSKKNTLLRKHIYEMGIEEETGLTPELISKYYVERTLHQPWIPSYH